MERTEKEKMIAGDLYFAGDPELVADRKDARVKMRAINSETDAAKRELIVKSTFGKTGNHVYIEPTISFDYGYNISVGENFYCNFNSIFLDICPITIGDNCMFGPNCQLYAATHPVEPVKRNSGMEFGKPITIGDNVWFGGSVVITPGVTLGNNVVVAAGSVVTKSFPDNVVLGGNPARIIRTIDEDDKANKLEAARKKIDAIDEQLVALLEKRLQAVTEVTAYKKENKKDILDQSREDAVLEKVAQRVENPLFEETMVATFQDIMKQSRNFQSKELGE
ncbi:chorismate mutase [Enterococcus pallens]|uniref:Acetyltransferase n=1 Tax=Enterococcus pallens ATCC BAA-351 TaxID=1158607 RepID=R2QFX9_9ENTE|nr:chorismate mutase [Enterococcus pallens]EOH95407.1 chorismate mutase [Enterococcus pallens ATCC BAA-351]EOU21456.1 chorismate mutase [Enterococcus pallens ATCC BAA-351]OJG76642.1 chorismate mutase [Enterococcus pallens]